MKAKYKELNFDTGKIRLLLEIESYGFDMVLYKQVKYDFWTMLYLFTLQKNHIDISQYIDIATLNEKSGLELEGIVEDLNLRHYMTDEEEYEESYY